MKKTYITPEMEIFNIQVDGALLAGSVFTPTDWNTGGDATSRMFEDGGMNFLMGGDDYSDLEKFLFP